MSFIDLFSNQAALYASARPTYPEALFDFIASQAPSTERAWDCATGSGQAAIGLARKFREVEATDASAAQIANAIPCPGVRYSVQAAERTDFAAASFDAVCVAQALHWFDLQKFFAEVSRVLRAGGVFAAWGYDWVGVDPAFDEEFQDSVLAVVASRWAPQNALLWSGYRDVTLPFERIEPPPVTMQIAWTFPQLLAHVQTWSAVRQCLAEDGREFFDRAEARLASRWGEPTSGRTVSFRLHVIAGRKSGDRMRSHGDRERIS
jgi:ubiquinone/menaquinone biosynthesis C-methylase UbiE